MISNLISKSVPKPMQIKIHVYTRTYTQRMGKETANPSGPESPHRDEMVILGGKSSGHLRQDCLMKQKLDE